VTLWVRSVAIGLILLMVSKTALAGPVRADELYNAGLREYHAGNFAAAKALFDQALESAVSTGNRDIEAGIRNGIGNLEIGVDRPERAYDSYKLALALFRSIPGRHFEIAATLRNLSSAEALQGNFDEAQKLLTEARKTLLSHPGLADSQLLEAEILNSQGILFWQQGKLRKAQRLFENAMRTRVAAGVPNELGDAQTLNNLGLIYRKQHKYLEAERAFLTSIAITARKLDPSHPDLTLTLGNLAELYTAMGRYDDASVQLERCLMILRGLDQPLYGRMVRTLGLAGSNYLKQGDQRKAVQSFQEVIDLSRSVTLKEPILPEIFDSYAELLQEQGNTGDAMDLRADAKRMRIKNALTVRARNTE
jgi:tetratricopeptide (TPR) repeat protein